jgi:hypothetical protein
MHRRSSSRGRRVPCLDLTTTLNLLLSTGDSLRNFWVQRFLDRSNCQIDFDWDLTPDRYAVMAHTTLGLSKHAEALSLQFSIGLDIKQEYI